MVVNLDPYADRDTFVHLDMPALGLEWDAHFTAHDAVSGQAWHWGERAFVRLGRV